MGKGISSGAGPENCLGQLKIPVEKFLTTAVRSRFAFNFGANLSKMLIGCTIGQRYVI